ncbi:MAG: polysaccharide pyruvyl transferase family protein [Bdellovibrio sp.]
MLAKRGKTIFAEVASPRRLLAIGSVLHYAQDNSVIWGSGLNGSVFESSHSYRSLDVRSVRGPITRAFLKKRGVEAPEVYGDPGLLIKVLTGDRFGRQKSSKVGVVPHFSDLSRPDIMRLKGSENVLVIDPYRSWNTVVDQIASCDFVVSSSLHGLVVADAFEIPSIYVRLSEREGVLKYEDYYAGTDRELSFASTIDEAMAHQGAKKLRYDTAKLMAVFPYDIWLSGFVP